MTFRISQSGFTIVEMVLTVAIIGILAAFSIPVYGNLFTRNDLDDAKMILVQSLRQAIDAAQAENDATAADPNPSWGVNVQNTKITVFQGTSYAGRTASLDEVYPVGNSVSFSNFTDGNSYLTFNPYSGFSSQAATQSVTLTSPSGETRVISVSPDGGKVEY